MTASQEALAPSCPLPITKYPHVLMAHGGGGRLMNQLIDKVFISTFANPALSARHDSADLEAGGAHLAFTTDSYVVHPLFFPGGDIGRLAVHGTINDLAMSGARPLFLSAGFIIEEGLKMETLWRIVQSMAQAAREANVQIVTGDTKVVDRGKGDGVYINTAGVGVIEHQLNLAPQSVAPGDVVLLSGDIGRHGMAVMSEREGLTFETSIETDSAALADPVLRLLNAGVKIHCLRDLTRGGLASALNEIAETAHLDIAIDERAVPVLPEVMGACEIIGLDPLYVANEGRFIAFVPPEESERALEIMRGHSLGVGCTRIGTVGEHGRGIVTLKNLLGTTRILDLMSGEQLPRIC